ncbi:type 1 glutamine amidotransferase [Pseudomonas sp. EL_65y_Pfl2_R95]|uniref:type 1 glutamine amidotransferase n=1 Tax=Pseudomonas sp. EL_65y_Pfl2_R95 TaxID=3088698 RepID=UPI0030D7913D
MTDILIITHIDYCTPGHLATVLDDAQLAFTELRADLNQLEGYDLDRPKAVAIMGGPMSVNDPLPWLQTEIKALQHFIKRDIPLLGHCLGGQLLAKALGAPVSQMGYTESGWQGMNKVEGAEQSPWLAHLPESFEIFQWHGDTFAMPEGAQPLLSNQWCPNQAFAMGDKILALQGHPEMTAELVSQWLHDWSHLLDASQPSQQSVEFMLDKLDDRVSALNKVAEGFYRHWLSQATKFSENPGVLN